MNRPQWLLVAFIGVVAVLAYSRTSQIARHLGIAYKPIGKVTGGIV